MSLFIITILYTIFQCADLGIYTLIYSYTEPTTLTSENKLDLRTNFKMAFALVNGATQAPIFDESKVQVRLSSSYYDFELGDTVY